MKVHTCIQGNEGVPCDVDFTSVATHDHFMLCPGKLNKGDILAIDRAYIDYAKFEEMTQRGVICLPRLLLKVYIFTRLVPSSTGL